MIICATWSTVSFGLSPCPRQKQDSIWLMRRCGPSTAAGRGGRLAVMRRVPLRLPAAWHTVSQAQRRKRHSGEGFALESKGAWSKSLLGVNFGKVCVPAEPQSHQPGTLLAAPHGAVMRVKWEK